MKRTVKPFVVERKRRPAGAGEGPPSIWSKADGEAFREQVKGDRPDEAPDQPAQPRPVAHTPTKPRILTANAAKPSSQAEASPVEAPQRAKRASTRRLGPEGEVGGPNGQPDRQSRASRGNAGRYGNPVTSSPRAVVTPGRDRPRERAARQARRRTQTTPAP